jgi:hypothetical protein
MVVSSRLFAARGVTPHGATSKPKRPRQIAACCLASVPGGDGGRAEAGNGTCTAQCLPGTKLKNHRTQEGKISVREYEAGILCASTGESRARLRLQAESHVTRGRNRGTRWAPREALSARRGSASPRLPILCPKLFQTRWLGWEGERGNETPLVMGVVTGVRAEAGGRAGGRALTSREVDCLFHHSHHVPPPKTFHRTGGESSPRVSGGSGRTAGRRGGGLRFGNAGRRGGGEGLGTRAHLPWRSAMALLGGASSFTLASASGALRFGVRAAPRVAYPPPFSSFSSPPAMVQTALPDALFFFLSPPHRARYSRQVAGWVCPPPNVTTGRGVFRREAGVTRPRTSATRVVTAGWVSGKLSLVAFLALRKT